MHNRPADDRREPADSTWKGEMSRIAPDIPELAHIPEVIRPFLWTRATVRAAGSMTLQLGGLVFLSVCTAATQMAESSV